MSSYLNLFARRFSGDVSFPDGTPKPVDQGGIADALNGNAIKIFDDDTGAQALFAYHANPNILVNVRSFGALEEPFKDEIPSAGFAVAYWANVQNFVRQFPKDPRIIFSVWPNEPPVDKNGQVDVDGLTALCSFWAKLAEVAAADDRRIAAGCFGVGANLHDKVWQVPALLDMFDALKKYNHFLDLHAYYAPSLSADGYEPYLFPWRILRRVVGSARIPEILCGEFGIDNYDGQHPNWAGYRSVSVGNEAYAADLIWAEAGLAADKVNAFVYWVAAANYEPFMNFNINIGFQSSRSRDGDPSVWDRLQPYILSIKSREMPAPSPVPVPAPAPTPTGGLQPGPAVIQNGPRNFRQEPSTTSGVLVYELLDSGTPVTILSTMLEADGQVWAKVSAPMTGWIRIDGLRQ